MKINVLDIIDNDDGSADLIIEYSKEFPKMVREHYGKKRCTKKLIQKFILEGLENYIKTENK